jgi:hypothetical protein
MKSNRWASAVLDKRVKNFGAKHFQEDWRVTETHTHSQVYLVQRFEGEVAVENITETHVMLDLIMWWDAFETGANIWSARCRKPVPSSRIIGTLR